MDAQPQIDISKLSDADKRELNQFLENEAQKTNIQQSKESIWTIYTAFLIVTSLFCSLNTQIPYWKFFRFYILLFSL